MAMIADRIISPGSKLSCSGGMHPDKAQNTLGEELQPGEVDVHELYHAMDWVLERQTRNENKLAKTHLKDGTLVLLDVSSSFYKGKKSSLICRNPLLADERARKREELLKAAEAALDGLYVIRTCVSSERMNSDHVVLTYKSLAKVERAFRSLKSIDLHIRPIRHWNDDRIRAHVFLCMSAYYVEWHMRDQLPIQRQKATMSRKTPQQRSDLTVTESYAHRRPLRECGVVIISLTTTDGLFFTLFLQKKKAVRNRFQRSLLRRGEDNRFLTLVFSRRPVLHDLSDVHVRSPSPWPTPPKPGRGDSGTSSAVAVVLRLSAGLL